MVSTFYITTLICLIIIYIIHNYSCNNLEWNAINFSVDDLASHFWNQFHMEEKISFDEFQSTCEDVVRCVDYDFKSTSHTACFIYGNADTTDSSHERVTSPHEHECLISDVRLNGYNF